VKCACGVELKQFWIWQDANGIRHASHFEPTTGLERSVLAATSRDALLPITAGATPRHQVADADDLERVWPSRCSSDQVPAATTGLQSATREPATAR
jgi:hypothetical protein